MYNIQYSTVFSYRTSVTGKNYEKSTLNFLEKIKIISRALEILENVEDVINCMIN